MTGGWLELAMTDPFPLPDWGTAEPTVPLPPFGVGVANAERGAGVRDAVGGPFPLPFPVMPFTPPNTLGVDGGWLGATERLGPAGSRSTRRECLPMRARRRGRLASGRSRALGSALAFLPVGTWAW